MDLNDQIEKLQKKPYETRVKILWAAVIICALILVVIWILSIKNTFKDIDADSLIKTDNDPRVASVETQLPLLAVERVEKNSNNFKIYFNLHNQTADILNVPKMDNIDLFINDQILHPTQITNRQGQVFVQKVLSDTQAFGILTFDKLEGDRATLTFDNMFFEESPVNIFKQKLDLELNNLNSDANPRN